MECFSLVVSPKGHLLWEPGGDEVWPDPDAQQRIYRAMDHGIASALLHLVSRELTSPLPPSMAYWRQWARRYTEALCRQPEHELGQTPIPPPSAEHLGFFILEAPAMRGLEYLTPDVLSVLWSQLDAYTRARASAHPKGAAEFLHSLHPSWHLVGRVCFHLAFNKKDEAHPFAFLATYASGLGAHGQVQHRPLAQALRDYAGEKNRAALLHLLSPVQVATENSALAKRLLESGELYRPLAWASGQAYQFLREVPVLEAAGIRVRLPDLWKNNRPPRASVSVTIGGAKKSGIGLDTLMSFSSHVALEGEPLTPDEIRQLLAAGEGLTLIRGQWVESDPEKLKQALAYWEKTNETSPDGITLVDGLRLLSGLNPDAAAPPAAAWTGLAPGLWLQQVLDEMRDPARLTHEEAVPGLRATLRPYQKTGVGWLAFMSRLGLGACLADDMGLGKTIQVIALLLKLRDHEDSAPPSLLLAPASLLANWRAEITRFAPDLRHRILHPSDCSADAWADIQAKPAAAVKGCDLALTTYGMATRWEQLRAMDWNLVILDEAQAIKNPGTRQTKAAKQIRSRRRIALTGTPIENRLGDLWSLFDFLNPGLLGSVKEFAKLAKRTDEPAVTGAIRSLVKPYILRRMKTDKRIIADLPDKTEVTTYCGLSKVQAALYDQAVRELAEKIETADGIQRRGLVLAYIMRFKQICNHPSHWLRDGRFEAEASGKFRRLSDLAGELAERQEKALVFTQFQEITGPLAAFLAGIFGRSGLILHGGIPVAERRKLVDSFQREDGPPFFVLTHKAGGAGLNLTEASQVIHFDRWWNPAVENQATDRAFRIGQKRNVLVHKFVCQGTIEERIHEMIAEKVALARDILDAGGTDKLLTEMNNKELLRFVALDINKAVSE